ncbi:MAG: tandem-95 repeat protein, partial [Candidatus Neomarinimicrobiota bacterium]
EDDEPNTLDVATTTDEDVAVAVNLSAEEYDGDSYSFAIITDVTNGTTSLNGSTVTYTPNQDFNGEDTFTFEATDDTGRTMNVATATITVNPVNDAPVANNITNQVTDENRMMQLDITLDATDVDGDALTYNVTSTNNGTVTINDNIATYVPTQDWNGEDTFTYVANDGSLDSNTATVTITVNSVNDAPVTSNSEMTIDEDSLDGEFTKITDYATDVDGDALVYIITKLPFGGNLCQNAGATCGTVLAVGDTVTGENGIENSNPFYMPNENWHGQDQFEWKVNDGVFDSNISKVTVNVNAINDLPVVTNITTSTSEDNPVTFSVHNNITDPDGDSTHWSYFVETQPANGIVTVEDSNNGNYTYTPNENFNGTDSFTWYIYDDGNGPEPGNSNVATTTITVNSVNDVPVVNDTTATGVKNTTFKFFLPEAYDLESGSETSFHNSLILVSAPGNGTLFKNNNEGNDSAGNSLSVGDKINNTDDGNQARIWYQPSTDWSGTDTFTYKANDGEDDSNIATVTITVTNPRLITGQVDYNSNGGSNFEDTEDGYFQIWK